ncbi:small subunit of biphenly dioxygenase (plasmid) [Geobacillus genomosp. 3]|uniref:Small subunit of biphenly dioxygenase n=1 Tax=Geobacillus genomosp. 3 TaxID=1921421 RepID=Q7WZF0_GEOG3|nr:aromatic-ring-hydroxylating dioxygenase subunit beta [Geobacillus genomosp. 3]AGT33882.1 small subunit of biphenly dioxygenase [Geobacillus genomosp. 3]BAC79227.1 small subunit of biphenyl dioxygenase [Geobacillus genomosp. 3]
MKLELNSDVYVEVCRFLFREARLLDARAFREWLGLLTDDIVYRVPLRVTREKGQGSGFLNNMAHMDEDRQTLEMRIHRLETEYAWAEDPPSRTRHFVSNIEIAPGTNENELEVNSNLLVYRSRGDSPAFDILSAERQDVLRLVDEEWKLARRTILLDQTTLSTHNLSIFL